MPKSLEDSKTLPEVSGIVNIARSSYRSVTGRRQFLPRTAALAIGLFPGGPDNIQITKVIGLLGDTEGPASQANQNGFGLAWSSQMNYRHMPSSILPPASKGSGRVGISRPRRFSAFGDN